MNRRSLRYNFRAIQSERNKVFDKMLALYRVGRFENLIHQQNGLMFSIIFLQFNRFYNSVLLENITQFKNFELFCQNFTNNKKLKVKGRIKILSFKIGQGRLLFRVDLNSVEDLCNLLSIDVAIRNVPIGPIKVRLGNGWIKPHTALKVLSNGNLIFYNFFYLFFYQTLLFIRLFWLQIYTSIYILRCHP